MTRRLLAAWLALALAPGRDAAAQALVTDRPDFTESAVTVPAGRVQLEAGGTWLEESGRRTLSLGELLLRAALGRRIEARIGLAPEWRTGPEPTGVASGGSVGFKLAVLEPSPTPSARPAVALIGQLGTSWDSEPGGGGVESEAKLCLAWPLADGWGLSSNLNVGAPSRGDLEGSGSVSLGFPLASEVGGYLEFFAFTALEDPVEAERFVNGGVTLALGVDAQLDARLGRALHREGEWFAGAGLSRRW